MMDYAEMRPVAEGVADVMKTLAHPKRLLALCALVDQERSVGELAAALGVRDQAMSQQLAILRAKGLVTTRRENQTIYYRLASAEIRTIMESLYKTYCPPAPA
ncbi:ArsR/SmtB family transcription factor [Maricaulis sp.]|uniref:ArsR/SmtB family transcription factor n=1 Tax=Maricaulis sp. TaxID=1486257 RepID=UPI003A951552